jgi:ribosomal protein S12 methylthiotransferase accessory factor
MNPIRIGHVQKHFFDGTHRVISPEETYSKINPLMDAIGVTDVIDITPLDRLGIPVYSALRPSAAKGSVKVHAGKGKEPLHAEISAMMEALERFCGEYRGDSMEFSSWEDLGLHRALDPRELILSRPLEIGEQIHWTQSWDIMNNEMIYVPSNAVFHPYDPLGLTNSLFRSDTNGLASGNVMEEAILHAMFEVVERDALSLAERNRSMGTRITIEEEEGTSRQLINHFEDHGIEIHLWLLDGKTGLPTVAAAADDIKTQDPAMLVIGSGTHASPEIAVIRALTEVAQSRASYLQGGRKDPFRERVIKQAGYDRLKRINKMWFADADTIGMEEIPDLSTDYIDEDIEISLKEISEHADRVCVCDLSRTPVPVVRVIIPGFEISYMDSSRVPSR